MRPQTPQMHKLLAGQAAAESQKFMDLQADPRYLLLKQEKEIMSSGEALEEAQNVTLSRFRQRLSSALTALLTQLQAIPDSQTMGRQLAETYEWYRRQVLAQPEAAAATAGPVAAPAGPAAEAGARAPHFHELGPEDLAACHTLPGSAFFGPPQPFDEARSLSLRRTDDSDGDRSPTAAAQGAAGGAAEELPPQPPVAQLPPPHERLRHFETKHVASPLSARKLKAAFGSPSPSPDFLDRPFTPSTATGGFTARSIPSARSTPSPLPSRPTSAASSYRRPLTATGARSTDAASPRRPLAGGLPPRPGTALGTYSAAAAERRPALLRTEEEEKASEVVEAPEEALEAAELRMEERWLRFRHREISNQMAADERRAVVRDWAERRARVEEEIARNAETSRYQSDLRRRSQKEQEGAREDQIQEALAEAEAGALAAAAAEGGPLPAAGSAAAVARRARSAAAARRPGKDTVPHFDVSKVDIRETGKVRFSWDGGQGGAAGPRATPKPPASARAAYLRRLHKRVLDTESTADTLGGEEGEGEEDAAQAAPRAEAPVYSSVFDTDAGGEHVSLSVYTSDGTCAVVPADGAAAPAAPLRRADDSDVLASVCKHWWRGQENLPPGVDKGLEELRFKQMKEVEEVKRVFARQNRPIDSTVLERALIMPAHRMTGAGATLKSSCSLPSNPFFKVATKKQKKKGKVTGAGKRGKKLGGKQDAGSPSASAAARRRLGLSP